ncbi:MAG: hypothetical protein A3B78_00195 [Omnitrophica WOR_2 bacterium RIFCSPHIGHO2_02_FULL_67_20]|nr:MAG: hypothetical protein A3B78_00195 [Omnitrophica WOR_2 bacterium RIFCSPHIGHO2_02_FULL_67_20]
MHRAIGYISKRFVQVRPGEGQKVFLTFLYFFLIITSYYLIKPVSRSLVLGDLGSRVVPYVDLVSAILMGPIVAVFAKLVDRVPKARLVSGSFWAVAGILLVFWRLLAHPIPWLAGAFYVWVNIFSVLVVTLFWLVANDLYRPREAKRLFGFIGSGGILGGIVGSSIAAVGAQLIGTEQLLLLAAAVLVGCWLVVRRLWTLVPEPVTPSADPAAGGAAREPRPMDGRRETFLSNPGGFVRLLLQSRYLLLLVIMVGLNKLIATLMYYQLNPFIEATFPGQDAKTTFTSVFFGGMNVIAFIVQFFCTSLILRRWGFSVALFALPLGLLAGSTALLVAPAFWVAAVTELYDGSLNYSLQQTTKEMLYLPINRSIRYKVKPFIDMVVFRFGKGIAALIGIVLLDRMGMPARYLSLIALPLLMAWIVAAVWLRRDYVARIRTILQAHAVSRRQRLQPSPAAPAGEGRDSLSMAETAILLEGMRAAPPPPPGETSASPEPFGALMDGQPSSRKLVLLDRLVGTAGPASAHGKALLEELAAYELRVTDSAEMEHGFQRLKSIIGDQQEPMATRRQAIRVLARTGDQAAVDYLFGVVTVESDAILRQEAVRGMVRLRIRGGRLEFPVQLIRRQIASEVANHQQIVHVAQIYRQHHRGPVPADDALLALLRVLMEESVEQIFRLLMLLYRPEDIHLVYEQLRVPDGYVRADAIELLDNLVDAPMRPIIFPILDEDRFLAALEELAGATHEPTTAYRLLQGAIWDHNCWLSVTTLCAVGKLRLTTMRQELERASRNSTPLIAAAAKVALHLATLP